MFNLDPGKLLVIAVVAIILLGPDRLPQVARQVGGAWRSFNEFRHRMESEVRSSMPDLPPTSEIARLARSPSALLNHLSNMSPDDEVDDGDDGVPDGSFQPPVSTNGAGTLDETGAHGAVPDDRDGPECSGPGQSRGEHERFVGQRRNEGLGAGRAGRRGSRRRCPASCHARTGRAAACAACPHHAFGAGGHRTRRPDAQLIGPLVATLPFTAKRKERSSPDSMTLGEHLGELRRRVHHLRHRLRHRGNHRGVRLPANLELPASAALFRGRGTRRTTRATCS